MLGGLVVVCGDSARDHHLSDGYNTNLAAEFFVLSCMHRLGLNATLTLGNKKGVDIVVVRDVGEAATVEVKGLAGTTGWPVDNVKESRPSHFIVLVCYLGRIADPTTMPEVYVIPSQELGPLVYHAPGGRKVIRLAKVRQEGSAYLHAWGLIAGAAFVPPAPVPSPAAQSSEAAPNASGGAVTQGGPRQTLGEK